MQGSFGVFLQAAILVLCSGRVETAEETVVDKRVQAQAASSRSCGATYPAASERQPGRQQFKVGSSSNYARLDNRYPIRAHWGHLEPRRLRRADATGRFVVRPWGRRWGPPQSPRMNSIYLRRRRSTRRPSCLQHGATPRAAACRQAGHMGDGRFRGVAWTKRGLPRNHERKQHSLWPWRARVLLGVKGCSSRRLLLAEMLVRLGCGLCSRGCFFFLRGRRTMG
jgi:hypothetical protein